MAANVGGMASPIASPQNVIAIGVMTPSPSWPEWFAIAVPMCIVIDVCIWMLLLVIYRPADEQTAPPELYSNQHISDRKLTGIKVYVVAVTVGTIFLWCIESMIEDFIGDMGMIAIIPIICFYGAGVLTKDDWNSMLWSGKV